MPFNICLKSACLVPDKLQRALGNLTGSRVPPPPHQQKITICKGRDSSLFSVPLHALTNSLAMFPSSQAGRKAEDASGRRQAGGAGGRAPFVEHPRVPLAFTWGCSRHGYGRVFPAGAEPQLLPLLSRISIHAVLLRPVRSPAGQQQVLRLRRG